MSKTQRDDVLGTMSLRLDHPRFLNNKPCSEHKRRDPESIVLADLLARLPEGTFDKSMVGSEDNTERCLCQTQRS